MASVVPVNDHELLSSILFINMASELYDDIISLILEFIWTDDSYPRRTKTLAACRQVCKRMATLVDPHFFRSIHLVLRSENGPRKVKPHPTRSLDTLCQALQSNPSIPALIRHFSISTHLEMLEPDKSDGWIHHNPHIPIILSKLENLSHFGLMNYLKPVSWSNLSQNMTKAVQDLHKISTLMSLDIQHVHGLPLGWITRCENLTSLCLVEVEHGTLQDDALFPDIEAIQMGRVQNMEVSTRTFYPLTAEFHQAYALRFFATVEKIKVVHDYDGSLNYVLPILLQGVEKTLKEVEIVMYDLTIKGQSSIVTDYPESASGTVLDLTTISDWIWISGLGNYHLEVLEKIKIVHPSYRVDARTLPELIPWFLGHPHQPSQTVHTIHIAFIPTQLPTTAGWRPYERTDWARIDPIVQRLYPTLKTFILEFQDEYFVTRPSRGTVEEHMRRMIPRIVENESIILRVILPDRTVYQM
ncbi:hypothetical protein BJ165DRAFT_321137 [Panaeolus papilionaceus]|nr:hypothetical protein BJ165DRAFT_321137 [Panaeolus papilionaceus]